MNANIFAQTTSLLEIYDYTFFVTREALIMDHVLDCVSQPHTCSCVICSLVCRNMHECNKLIYNPTLRQPPMPPS